MSLTLKKWHRAHDLVMNYIHFNSLLAMQFINIKTYITNVMLVHILLSRNTTLRINKSEFFFCKLKSTKISVGKRDITEV